MEQFNLQKYLTNPSLKIITRDGRPARVVCTDVKGNYPVIGLVLHNDTEEFMYNFTEDGRWSTGIKSDRDLFFLEQEHVNSSFTPEKNKKFDPKSLKPFNQVLVRNDLGATWFCTTFSHIYREEEITYPYYTASGMYAYCIPYNSDTKNLVGTKENAPEYYRYWED